MERKEEKTQELKLDFILLKLAYSKKKGYIPLRLLPNMFSNAVSTVVGVELSTYIYIYIGVQISLETELIISVLIDYYAIERGGLITTFLKFCKH